MPFNATVGLGAPTNLLVGASQLFTANFDNEFYAHSIFTAWGMDDHTPGEGPLEIGFAHSDYTVAEIGEALDNTSNTRGDLVENERRGRKVRSCGWFSGQNVNEVLFDGATKRCGLGFVLADGTNLNFWTRNHDTTMTTGSQINLIGVLYGRWV